MTPPRIEVESLTTFEVAGDGRHVRLNFLDREGAKACVELPADSLNQLLMSMPRMLQTALRNRHGDSSLRFVHPLDDFTLELGEPDASGRTQFILTLATGDGFGASFSANAAGLSSLGEAIEKSAEDSTANLCGSPH